MASRSKFGRMDWKTSSRDARWATHWRIHLSVAVGALIGVGIFYALYPHGFWFHVIWCGAAVGQAAALVASVPWQLASPDRVATTSGWFIVIGFLMTGTFALMSMFVFQPMLRAQETERAAFHALAARDIVAIAARGRCVAGRIERADTLGDVRHRMAAAEPFVFDHETRVAEFKLSLAFADGKTIEYAAAVPQRHPRDVAVETGSATMRVEGLGAMLQIEPNSRGSGCR